MMVSPADLEQFAKDIAAAEIEHESQLKHGN
jgi:hypothetical protein